MSKEDYIALFMSFPEKKSSPTVESHADLFMSIPIPKVESHATPPKKQRKRRSTQPELLMIDCANEAICNTGLSGVYPTTALCQNCTVAELPILEIKPHRFCPICKQDDIPVVKMKGCNHAACFECFRVALWGDSSSMVFPQETVNDRRLTHFMKACMSTLKMESDEDYVCPLCLFEPNGGRNYIESDSLDGKTIRKNTF